MADTEPLTPDAVRALIAEPTADELFDLALNGGGTRGEALVRLWRAGRDAALPVYTREDADLDAEPTPNELFALAVDEGGPRGDALVRLWRAGRDSAHPRGGHPCVTR